MTRLLFSLLLAIFILGETQELIAGPLSRIKSHRHQQAKRSRLRNSYQGYITKTREEGDSNQMLIKNNVPPQGFVALFNGIDLKGWYGWGTQDPQDFRNMSPEEKLEYKKKSIYGGLLNKKGVDAGDHINAHWRVDNDELVNDGKGL